MTQQWGRQVGKLKLMWEVCAPRNLPPLFHPSHKDLGWGLGCLPSFPSIYLARALSLLDSYCKPKLTALQNPLKKPSIN